MSIDPAALFQPLRVGALTLSNRIVMAPMTRHRATLDGVPTPEMARYYRQRASAGLIVSEGVYPCERGKGNLFIPGLCNAEQVAGWRFVTDAVHEAGGLIVCQLMHGGRLSDPLMQPGQQLPLAPSAVRPDPRARHYTFHSPRVKRPYPTPRAMRVEDIEQAIRDYADAARRAEDAGFDGVEIHAASGYLPHQFLATNTNLRDDAWGGDVPRRARFLLEVVEAIGAATRPDFVAVKLSPGWTFHDVFDDDPQATFTHVVRELSARRIAYLQVGDYGMDWDVHGLLRPLFEGPYMAVSGYSRAGAAAMIAGGGADLVAFGQAYIANPDLAERYRHGWGLNPADGSTFYTQGAEGYTDYPCHGEVDDQAGLLDCDVRPPSRGGQFRKAQPGGR